MSMSMSLPLSLSMPLVCCSAFDALLATAPGDSSSNCGCICSPSLPKGRTPRTKSTCSQLLSFPMIGAVGVACLASVQFRYAVRARGATYTSQPPPVDGCAAPKRLARSSTPARALVPSCTSSTSVEHPARGHHQLAVPRADSLQHLTPTHAHATRVCTTPLALLPLPIHPDGTNQPTEAELLRIRVRSAMPYSYSVPPT